MSRIRVDLSERSYDIDVSTATRDALGPFVRETIAARKAVLVYDENVEPHAEPVLESLRNVGFEIHAIVVPSGEEQKTLASASMLYDRLVDLRADRKTLILALGGGVIGDLAGFVAATFTRGLPLVMIPTTLLAMVDSSVGGKTGVNHPRGKNLIGSFHQPKGVWIDPSMMSTLPEREFRSGLAEVVKYGVILDEGFFDFVETNADNILARDEKSLEHIIARSCRLKADVVERDERETEGLRVVLNYGHTFAHAFETVGGYGAWLHGEAVASGMVCASRLAERRGQIPSEVTQRQVALLRKFGLPVQPCEGSIDDFLAVMRSDKKVEEGRLRFILPTRLGEVRLFDDVSDRDVSEVLLELRETPL